VSVYELLSYRLYGYETSSDALSSFYLFDSEAAFSVLEFGDVIVWREVRSLFVYTPRGWRPAFLMPNTHRRRDETVLS